MVAAHARVTCASRGNPLSRLATPGEVGTRQASGLSFAQGPLKHKGFRPAGILLVRCAPFVGQSAMESLHFPVGLRPVQVQVDGVRRCPKLGRMFLSGDRSRCRSTLFGQ